MVNRIVHFKWEMLFAVLISERLLKSCRRQYSFPLDALQLLKVVATPINISFPIDNCLSCFVFSTETRSSWRLSIVILIRFQLDSDDCLPVLYKLVDIYINLRATRFI